MAAMAAAMSVASSSKLSMLGTSSSFLSKRFTSSVVAPVRVAKFSVSPRASVSGSASSDVAGLWTPPMASQAAPPGMRSAEADVMGLMLKQRIVFLGNQMDDFVADAIISQLLLLDAVDPKKEIRLFINCPGGSIRCVNE